MIRRILVAVAAASAAIVGAASAAVTTTFEYSGETTLNGATTGLFGPTFPAGGVFRTTDRDAAGAAITGNGADSPVFTFANSSISVGEASARSQTRVTVDITNDSVFAATATWDFLIFAGGAGIIGPALNGAECTIGTLDLCQSYLPPFGSHQAAASLQFGVTLDGIELYSGDIFVDADTQTANFNNIALNNFAALPGNGQYFRWDETLITQSLGLFAPGETKTLEFFVATSVISSGQDGCFRSGEFFFCTGAQAGFGDPDGMNGGIIPRSYSLTGSFEDTITFEPAGEIPVPGAIWLFLSGIGLVAGRRKLMKRG